MSEVLAIDSQCGACGTVLVRLCPCCELGDGRHTRASSDTVSPNDRGPGRTSSEPPPLPALALVTKRSAFETQLISINQRSFGPADALDLTDDLLDESEDLHQDQIDVLFEQ